MLFFRSLGSEPLCGLQLPIFALRDMLKEEIYTRCYVLPPPPPLPNIPSLFMPLQHQSGRVGQLFKPATAGIDSDSSTDVYIYNVTITTGDDAIVAKTTLPCDPPPVDSMHYSTLSVPVAGWPHSMLDGCLATIALENS